MSQGLWLMHLFDILWPLPLGNYQVRKHSPFVLRWSVTVIFSGSWFNRYFTRWLFAITFSQATFILKETPESLYWDWDITEYNSFESFKSLWAMRGLSNPYPLRLINIINIQFLINFDWSGNYVSRHNIIQLAGVVLRKPGSFVISLRYTRDVKPVSPSNLIY